MLPRKSCCSERPKTRKTRPSKSLRLCCRVLGCLALNWKLLANVRSGSFASILVCPRHVRLGGNLGSAGCPVLPIPHPLLSNVLHDVAIAGTIKLLHGPPVT